MSTEYWLPFWIVLTSTLLAITFICRLKGNLHAERAKRIEAIQHLMDARAERDEWQETSRGNLDARSKAVLNLVEYGAESRKLITKQAEQIDSLMNGDRRCVDGHRYYSGITCPHCGAQEEEFVMQRASTPFASQ